MRTYARAHSCESTARARRACGAAERGFTLVELGAVVAIVGVLAVLAIVGYRRLITASHSTEATHMLGAIRTAQEGYKAETGTYASISGAPGASAISVSVTNGAGTACTNPPVMYPSGTVGSVKYGWGGASTGTQAPNAGLDWNSIPIHADGAVMYGYSTQAGYSGTGPSNISTMLKNGAAYTLSFPAPTTDWYLAAACGDPNGDGIYSAYVASSFSNDIFESNDGE